MSANVDQKHPDFITMTPSWETMYDVCISEKHIHDKDIAAEGDADNAYLPILDAMTDTQYKAYTRRAEFPLYTRHALDSFVGMCMRKDMIIEGVDKDHEFFENVDAKGTTIGAYAEELVRQFLQYRRCGTLVEMPNVDPNLSKAEAEKQNVKPRLAFYDHTAIINWKVSTENNVTKLKLVTLEETVDAATDEFEHVYENRWRVLKLENGVYSQEIYNNDKELIEIHTPEMNGKLMDFIPFIIHGGIPVTSPVMLPIAEQNIHWYMKDADYQHGLHYTALPTPWIVGVDPNDPNTPTTIGPQKLWVLPIGASCGMLEFSGAGLNEVRESQDRTLNNIVMLSSQLLVPKSAYDESATAANVRNASETASLSSIVNKLSEELTQAVKWASKWGGFDAEGTEVTINSDFIPMTLSGADVSAYVSSVIQEGFSKRTLFDLLKKGEIIEGDRKFEDEMADIERESKEREDRQIAMAKATQPPAQTGQDGATPAEKKGQQ